MRPQHGQARHGLRAPVLAQSGKGGRGFILGRDDLTARATKPGPASARGSASGQSDPREPGVARSHETSSHRDGTMIVSLRGGLAYTFGMTTTLIGYARCSTDKQDLAAQKAALEKLGVAPERIYTDRGLTGTNRSRPGLDQALAAV